MMVSCLQCGAYDDRYCGCWRDRAPGYDLGSGPFGRSVSSSVFSVSQINRSFHLQPHASPLLDNLLHEEATSMERAKLGVLPSDEGGGRD